MDRINLLQNNQFITQESPSSYSSSLYVDIKDLFQNHFSSDTDSIDVIFLASKGTFHKIFLVNNYNNKYIIRINDFEYTDYNLLIDHEITNIINNCHIPSVKSYLTDITRKNYNFDYQIISFADGNDLISLRKNINYNYILGNLGEILKKLHEIKGNKYGPVSLSLLINNNNLQGLHTNWADYLFLNLESHLNYCHKYNYINLSEKNIIYNLYNSNIKLFDNTSCPSSLLHCDLGDHNIFAYGKDVRAIIDWEDAILGDPIFELAHWATFQLEDNYQYLLDKYFANNSKLNQYQIWPKFWLYYLRVTIAKTVHRHKFNYQDKPMRIQQALNKLLSCLEGEQA